MRREKVIRGYEEKLKRKKQRSRVGSEIEDDE